MTDTLNQVANRLRISLGATQVTILNSLLGNGTATCWTPGADIPDADIVILEEAPTGLELDVVCSALSGDSIVVIPYGENPQFDAIKLRLHCHGTIGASSPDAPHLVWWGSRTPAKASNAGEFLRGAHAVSCVRRHTHEERDALAFSKALSALGVSYTFDISETHVYCDDRSTMRSECLLRSWNTSNKPLIWLDPLGNIDLSTIEPTFDGADFAAIYEPERGFSTAMLYFERTSVAHELLIHWNKLCAEFPRLPASFVLDTAWAMISAQRPLVTRWLSPSHFHSVIAQAELQPLAPSLVVQDQVECRGVNFKRARRAARFGAPEPHSIAKSRIPSGAPIMFVTSSQGYTARDIAKLTESILDVFDRDGGGFGSLAIIICKDLIEMAETINVAGDGHVLIAGPGTVIDPGLFSDLALLEVDDRVTYLGSEIREKATTPTGQNLLLTRSTVMFGRGRHFFGGVAKAPSPQPLRLVK